MPSTQTPEVEKIRATIESLSPTRQKRYIDSLPVPEDKEDVVALLMLLREGAIGNLSRFENVKKAYLRKYNEVSRKAESLLNDKEQKQIRLPRPKGRVIRAILAVIAVIAAVFAAIIIVLLLIGSFRSCSSSHGSDRNITNPTEKYDELQKEYEKALKEANANAGNEVTGQSDNNTSTGPDLSSLSYLNSDGTATVHLSGTVAKAPVIMDLTIDFSSNNIWGDYYYVRIPGKKRIVLKGSLDNIEADEYCIRYNAVFYELDSDGNATGGTFEGNGDIASWGTSEFLGKYTSVKGVKSEVYLFNEEEEE